MGHAGHLERAEMGRSGAEADQLGAEMMKSSPTIACKACGLLGSVAIGLALFTTSVSAQWSAMKRGSDNIEVVGHLPLGGSHSAADMDVEQELSRPYAYVGRTSMSGKEGRGMDIIDISDPAQPSILYSWRVEDPDLHVGTGGMDVKHFKVAGRYYAVQSLQFRQGGPNPDLGAVILDVTGLPDPSTVWEVARVREPLLPGGFHNIFVYKHSDGRVLLFATVQGPQANVYDLGMLVKGATTEEAYAGRVPVGAEGPEAAGYHDFYVAYHPDTDQDRFYGGGTGGYFVYDVTDPRQPEIVITLAGVRGVSYGHTFTPSPDGRYAVAETEYQFAPLRIFDLKPALDGETININRPIAGWTADYQNLVHNHEVRWPWVFVSGYLDGLQIFNLQDPSNPVTVGYYDTYLGTRQMTLNKVFGGTFGVDIRNADGLIVVNDSDSGFWTFRMDGFQGWNGEQWGQPDISSAQKWDEPVRKPIS
jgi:hypothetical protein